MLLGALQSLAMLLILMAFGFGIAEKPWFQGGDELLSRLLVKVIMPFNVLLSILDNFEDIGDGQTFVRMLLTVAGMMTVSLLVGWVFAALLKIRHDRKGIFISATAFPNIVLLGFPFVESVYGAAALRYAVVYFLMNTVFFWVLCPLILSRFSGEGTEEHFRWKSLRKCLSPSLLAMLLGLLLLLSGLRLPKLATDTMRKLAQCTTGLSMLFIGCIIRKASFSIKTLLNRDVLMLLVLKLFVVMGVLLLLLRCLPIPTEAKKVFLLLTAMPACVNMSLLAHQYRCDYAFCALVSTVMNVVCVLSVPVYVLLFEHLL